jgi:3-deoxy-7-phosphoheptulonate synthase
MGHSMPNYHYENLRRVKNLYEERFLTYPALIVDTNHANSGKDPFEQPRIVREVLASRKYSEDLRRLVKGFMVESYLVDGKQEVGGTCYGQSITDPCLGWEKTERLVLDLADSL